MEITTALAIISPIAAMIFGVAAIRRGQRSDDSSAGREMGIILTEIGYIKSQMDSLDRKFENREERYTKIAERVSAVEQSAKSAHHRIDTITGKGKSNETNN